MSYQDIIKRRRSIYALNDQLPITEDEVVKTIEDAIVISPSAFNMQSVRAIILLGAQHKALWEGIVTDTLKAVVAKEKFEPTAEKLAGFAAGAGTVLYFEDDDVVQHMKEQFPTYAAACDAYSGHGQGIAQVNVWNALAEKGVGANLQHYNPLIDDAVKARWDVPANHRFVAQFVFGGIAAPACAQERQSTSERIRVIR